MFYRTIRFRLTLWYSTILAVILAASGFIWHASLAGELQRHVDEKLMIVARDVAAFHLSTHGEHAVPHETMPDSDDHCQGMENFIRGHNWGEYVQILDDRGSIHCATSNLKGFHLPLTKLALQRSLQGEPHFEIIRTLGTTPIRMLTFPVQEQGRITDLIQIGEDLGGMESSLEHLRLMLLIFSPAALMVLGGGGWFLAGRTLAPVNDIIAAARQIKAENLSERLPVADTHDEIAALAETFNSLLARLEDSFNKVRQFSADASHELRTPLAILKGETEVALRWGKDPEELRQTLLSNLEEIDRMGHIIEDLLLLAKSEAGELRLQLATFSLGDLLQDLYLQGRTLGEPKLIDVVLRLMVEDDIRLRGDQFQLHRMLLNLVTNAIKYTPEGGQVSIGLAVAEQQAVLTVADNGIGIAPEHLPHIFERFYRVDSARNRQIGGTGLGLAIVKSIVEAHDGSITATSSPGTGSTFSVHLPLAGPRPRGKEAAAVTMSHH